MHNINFFFALIILLALNTSDAKKINDKKTQHPPFDSKFNLLATHPLPKFADFAAEVKKIKYTPKLKFTTKLSRRYKTTITYASKEEVNFAGHCVLTTWGCGTDCHGFAVIDKVSGYVYTMPGVEYVAGAMGNIDERIDGRPDSKLLILSGNKNDDEQTQAQYYYLWENNKFKLLVKAKLNTRM